MKWCLSIVGVVLAMLVPAGVAGAETGTVADATGDVCSKGEYDSSHTCGAGGSADAPFAEHDILDWGFDYTTDKLIVGVSTFIPDGFYFDTLVARITTDTGQRDDFNYDWYVYYDFGDNFGQVWDADFEAQPGCTPSAVQDPEGGLAGMSIPPSCIGDPEQVFLKVEVRSTWAYDYTGDPYYGSVYDIAPQLGAAFHGPITQSPTAPSEPAPEPTPSPTPPPSGSAPTARDISDTCPPASGSRFSDTSSDTHRARIECIADYEITTGYPDGTYRPGLAVSAQQIATFLIRTVEAAGGTVGAASATCGSGVHAVNVGRLVDAGIMESCSAGFDATRTQMARWTAGVLEVYAGIDAGNAPDYFRDDDGMPSTAQAAHNAVAHLGIVTGKSAGVFAPHDLLTRGQMATFLARVLDAIRDGG